MPLGKEVGLGPGHIVLYVDPVGTQRPPQQPLPIFQPISIVDKRSPISATAELWFYQRGPLIMNNPPCISKMQVIITHANLRHFSGHFQVSLG